MKFDIRSECINTELNALTWWTPSPRFKSASASVVFRRRFFGNSLWRSKFNFRIKNFINNGFTIRRWFSSIKPAEAKSSIVVRDRYIDKSECDSSACRFILNMRLIHFQSSSVSFRPLTKLQSFKFRRLS